MAATFSILNWVSSSGLTYTGNLSGDSLKVLRVKADETGFELAVAALTAVNVTAPLTVSGTTTRTIALAGLSNVGGNNQFPMSDGTVWSYVSSTGSGAVVRAAGANVSAFTVAELTAQGTAFVMGASTMGFFGKAPVGVRPLTEWTNTAFANPVTDTAAFNSQMGTLITWMQQVQGGLGNNTGYGVFALS